MVFCHLFGAVLGFLGDFGGFGRCFFKPWHLWWSVVCS